MSNTMARLAVRSSHMHADAKYIFLYVVYRILGFVHVHLAECYSRNCHCSKLAYCLSYQCPEPSFL